MTCGTRRYFGCRFVVFVAMVAALLLGTLQAAPPAQNSTASNRPVGSPVRIVMVTQAGNIYLDLYVGRAPITAANFLKYVDAGKFDGAAFYRAVRLDNQPNAEFPIEVIQGGILGPGGRTKPEFAPIPLEPTSQTGLKHVVGTISMARGAPDTATSEFFISLAVSPALDSGGKRNPDGKGFAAFGRVSKGMDVVRAIQSMTTSKSLGKPDLGVMQGQLLDDPVRVCKVFRLTVKHKALATLSDQCRHSAELGT